MPLEGRLAADPLPATTLDIKCSTESGPLTYRDPIVKPWDDKGHSTDTLSSKGNFLTHLPMPVEGRLAADPMPAIAAKTIRQGSMLSRAEIPWSSHGITKVVTIGSAASRPSIGIMLDPRKFQKLPLDWRHTFAHRTNYGPSAMKTVLLLLFLFTSLPFSTLHSQSSNNTSPLTEKIAADYESHLKNLFVHFHQNPELSMGEVKTAARLSQELRDAGFEVHEGLGETGIVALMKNGDGPTVMMRADMDGLPVKEDSGLPYMSTATQTDPITDEVRPVMHACGHDVHITSLVGTARYMAATKDNWSGTLMLIGQPAEERIMGARKMMEDNLWDKFEQPDYALAFHVGADTETGKIDVKEGAAFAGSNSVDIIVHGIGAHGASPHRGKDPIVLGSQIVMALQTLVSRELPPKHPGVVTVGAFNSGFKHNIISDRAHLQVTVRNTSIETRDLLLNGIKRIAENFGRAAGLPEDKLPEVIVSTEEHTPPTLNNIELTQRLKSVWGNALGDENVIDKPNPGMGAEDFPFFTTDPYIPSVYWIIGGTPKEDFENADKGGPAVPSHHSPFFKIDPDGSVPFGVETTVLALMDLMGRGR